MMLVWYYLLLLDVYCCAAKLVFIKYVVQIISVLSLVSILFVAFC